LLAELFGQASWVLGLTARLLAQHCHAKSLVHPARWLAAGEFAEAIRDQFLQERVEFFK